MAAMQEYEAFKNIANEVDLSKQIITFNQASSKVKNEKIIKYCNLHNAVLKENSKLQGSLITIIKRNERLAESINNLQTFAVSASSNNYCLKGSLSMVKKRYEQLKNSSVATIIKYEKQWEDRLAAYESVPLAIERQKLKNTLKIYKFKMMTCQEKCAKLNETICNQNTRHNLETQQIIIEFAKHMVKQTKNNTIIDELKTSTEKLYQKYKELQKEKIDLINHLEKYNESIIFQDNNQVEKVRPHLGDENKKSKSLSELPAINIATIGIPMLRLPSQKLLNNIDKSESDDVFKKPLVRKFNSKINSKNTADDKTSECKSKTTKFTSNMIEKGLPLTNNQNETIKGNTDSPPRFLHKESEIVNIDSNHKVGSEMKGQYLQNVVVTENGSDQTEMESDTERKKDSKIRIINEVQLKPEETKKILQNLINNININETNEKIPELPTLKMNLNNEVEELNICRKRKLECGIESSKINVQDSILYETDGIHNQYMGFTIKNQEIPSNYTSQASCISYTQNVNHTTTSQEVPSNQTTQVSLLSQGDYTKSQKISHTTTSQEILSNYSSQVSCTPYTHNISLTTISQEVPNDYTSQESALSQGNNQKPKKKGHMTKSQEIPSNATPLISRLSQGNNNQKVTDTQEEVMTAYKIVSSPEFKYGPNKNIMQKKNTNTSRSVYFQEDKNNESPNIIRDNNQEKRKQDHNIFPTPVSSTLQDIPPFQGHTKKLSSCNLPEINLVSKNIPKIKNITSSILQKEEKISVNENRKVSSEIPKSQSIATPSNITNILKDKNQSAMIDSSNIIKSYSEEYSNTIFANSLENFVSLDNDSMLSSEYGEDLDPEYYSKYMESFASLKADDTMEIENIKDEVTKDNGAESLRLPFNLFGNKEPKTDTKDDQAVKNDGFSFLYKPFDKTKPKGVFFNFMNE